MSGTQISFEIMLIVERVLVLFSEMYMLRTKHYVKVIYTSPLHFLSHVPETTATI